MSSKLLISIDGGGIKGYQFARVLSLLEDRVGPLAYHADMIVGTSTGGILALALGAGIPAALVADLYRQRGPEVFQRSWWQRISNPEGLRGPLYDPSPLREGLEELFGDRLVMDSLCDVMVTAYEPEDVGNGGRIDWAKRIVSTFMASGGDVVQHHMRHAADHAGYLRVGETADRTVFIKSWKTDVVDAHCVDAAMATSAAPTYFPDHNGLIDGGVYANNPALCGTVEMFKKYGEAPRVLSVGSFNGDPDTDDASPEAFDRMDERVAGLGTYVDAMEILVNSGTGT